MLSRRDYHRCTSSPVCPSHAPAASNACHGAIRNAFFALRVRGEAPRASALFHRAFLSELRSLRASLAFSLLPSAVCKLRGVITSCCRAVSLVLRIYEPPVIQGVAQLLCRLILDRTVTGTFAPLKEIMNCSCRLLRVVHTYIYIYMYRVYGKRKKKLQGCFVR